MPIIQKMMGYLNKYIELSTRISFQYILKMNLTDQNIQL